MVRFFSFLILGLSLSAFAATHDATERPRDRAVEIDCGRGPADEGGPLPATLPRLVRMGMVPGTPPRELNERLTEFTEWKPRADARPTVLEALGMTLLHCPADSARAKKFGEWALNTSRFSVLLKNELGDFFRVVGALRGIFTHPTATVREAVGRLLAAHASALRRGARAALEPVPKELGVDLNQADLRVLFGLSHRDAEMLARGLRGGRLPGTTAKAYTDRWMPSGDPSSGIVDRAAMDRYLADYTRAFRADERLPPAALWVGTPADAAAERKRLVARWRGADADHRPALASALSALDRPAGRSFSERRPAGVTPDYAEWLVAEQEATEGDEDAETDLDALTDFVGRQTERGLPAPSRVDWLELPTEFRRGVAELVAEMGPSSARGREIAEWILAGPRMRRLVTGPDSAVEIYEVAGQPIALKRNTRHRDGTIDTEWSLKNGAEWTGGESLASTTTRWKGDVRVDEKRNALLLESPRSTIARLPDGGEEETSRDGRFFERRNPDGLLVEAGAPKRPRFTFEHDADGKLVRYRDPKSGEGWTRVGEGWTGDKGGSFAGTIEATPHGLQRIEGGTRLVDVGRAKQWVPGVPHVLRVLGGSRHYVGDDPLDVKIVQLLRGKNRAYLERASRNARIAREQRLAYRDEPLAALAREINALYPQDGPIQLAHIEWSNEQDGGVRISEKHLAPHQRISLRPYDSDDATHKDYRGQSLAFLRERYARDPGLRRFVRFADFAENYARIKEAKYHGYLAVHDHLKKLLAAEDPAAVKDGKAEYFLRNLGTVLDRKFHFGEKVARAAISRHLQAIYETINRRLKMVKDGHYRELEELELAGEVTFDYFLGRRDTFLAGGRVELPKGPLAALVLRPVLNAVNSSIIQSRDNPAAGAAITALVTAFPVAGAALTGMAIAESAPAIMQAAAQIERGMRKNNEDLRDQGLEALGGQLLILGAIAGPRDAKAPKIGGRLATEIARQDALARALANPHLRTKLADNPKIGDLNRAMAELQRRGATRAPGVPALPLEAHRTAIRKLNDLLNARQAALPGAERVPVIAPKPSGNVIRAPPTRAEVNATGAKAEAALGRKLDEAQKRAAHEAHRVGEGEVGADGINPARIGNYTREQLLRKARILRDAGFDTADTRTLFEKGVCGRPQWAERSARKMLDKSHGRENAGQLAHPLDHVPRDGKTVGMLIATERAKGAGMKKRQLYTIYQRGDQAAKDIAEFLNTHAAEINATPMGKEFKETLLIPRGREGTEWTRATDTTRRGRFTKIEIVVRRVGNSGDPMKDLQIMHITPMDFVPMTPVSLIDYLRNAFAIASMKSGRSNGYRLVMS